MLKLKRLRVEKFRSVVKPAELSFADGINVLLGQNGTGKTTLLELISMVARSDFSSLAKEEFALEYELSASEGESLIVAIRNERAPGVKLQAPFDLGAQDVFRSSAEVLAGADRQCLVRYDAKRGLSVREGPWMGGAGPAACLEPILLMLMMASAAEHIGPPPPRACSGHRFDESLDLFRRATHDKDSLASILVDSESRWTPNAFEWLLMPDVLVGKMAASYIITPENLLDPGRFLLPLRPPARPPRHTGGGSQTCAHVRRSP